METNNRLILGTAWSSTWSMRAFLCAAPIRDRFDISWRDFDTQNKLIDTTDCPTSQVPVLKLAQSGITIVETFAIVDALADLGGLQWPTPRAIAWTAKSLCLEFQSQSGDLRRAIPMDLRQGSAQHINHPQLTYWHDRLEALHTQSTGDFLLGDYSIADAWIAPLYCRFLRVGYPISEMQRAYLTRLKQTDGWQQWTAFVDDLAAEYA